MVVGPVGSGKVLWLTSGVQLAAHKTGHSCNGMSIISTLSHAQKSFRVTHDINSVILSRV